MYGGSPRNPGGPEVSFPEISPRKSEPEEPPPGGERMRAGTMGRRLSMELRESRSAFQQASANRNQMAAVHTRYSSKKHNALKATTRVVDPSSLKVGRVGYDTGLRRYDVQPELDRKQPTIETYYKAHYRAKMGPRFGKKDPLTGKTPPMFSVHGLSNVSSVPLGDARVRRGASNFRETFTPPTTRAKQMPHLDHVQDGESVCFDANIGPMNLVAETEGAMAAAQATLREQRRKYYRNAVEHVDVKKVDALEAEIRENLNSCCVGPPGARYPLRDTFRFFDKDGRGCVSLEVFTETLATMGHDAKTNPFVSEDIIVALFARYDVQHRGFIDYYEFIKHLLGTDYAVYDLDEKEQKKVGGRVKNMLTTIRSTARPPPPHHKDHRLAHEEEVNVHALSDEAFARRQRIRKVFRSIDRDGGGTIDRSELQKLLVLLGVRVSAYEMQLIYNTIDDDGQGGVDFDEFYAWYTKEVVDEEDAAGPSSSVKGSGGGGGGDDDRRGSLRTETQHSWTSGYHRQPGGGGGGGDGSLSKGSTAQHSIGSRRPSTAGPKRSGALGGPPEPSTPYPGKGAASGAFRTTTTWMDDKDDEASGSQRPGGLPKTPVPRRPPSRFR